MRRLANYLRRRLGWVKVWASRNKPIGYGLTESGMLVSDGWETRVKGTWL